VLAVGHIPLVNGLVVQVFTFLLQRLNTIAVEIGHRPEAAYEPAYISEHALIASYVVIGLFVLLSQSLVNFYQQNRRAP
jgi:hypothetical protein